MEFKKYTKNIVVNRIKVKAEVTIEVHDDEYGDLMDQDFETDKQRDAYRRKVQGGSIFAGVIIVKACAEGLEGSDSLGCCELRSNNMFNSKPFERSVRSYLKDYGMESNALKELKTSLESRYDQLTTQAKLYKKFQSKGVK